MKTMTMEKAVECSLDKRIVIHTPTQEVYNRLEKYAKAHGIVWFNCNNFPEYGRDTCVEISVNEVWYCNIDFYRDRGYEIIELESPNELTITIKSDGHKIVSATCNDITATAKCNDTDTFNISKGSHMALKRLIDKMNEPVKEDNSNKIEKGDIVEIIGTGITYLEETIGLQGIVMEDSEVPFVKLPIEVMGDNVWAYDITDMKLIRKASK